jgi:hypothetical protein
VSSQTKSRHVQYLYVPVQINLYMASCPTTLRGQSEVTEYKQVQVSQQGQSITLMTGKETIAVLSVSSLFLIHLLSYHISSFLIPYLFIHLPVLSLLAAKKSLPALAASRLVPSAHKKWFYRLIQALFFRSPHTKQLERELMSRYVSGPVRAAHARTFSHRLSFLRPVSERENKGGAAQSR